MILFGTDSRLLSLELRNHRPLTARFPHLFSQARFLSMHMYYFNVKSGQGALTWSWKLNSPPNLVYLPSNAIHLPPQSTFHLTGMLHSFQSAQAKPDRQLRFNHSRSPTVAAPSIILEFQSPCARPPSSSSLGHLLSSSALSLCKSDAPTPQQERDQQPPPPLWQGSFPR